MTNILTQEVSQTNSATPPSSRRTLHLGPRRAYLVVGAIAVGVISLLYLAIRSGERSGEGDVPTPELPAIAADDKDGAATPSVVLLPEEKLSAAELKIELPSRETMTHVHTVPGRVVYNDNRHIEITAPTGGILTEVLVTPGDHVSAGQVLAWINSPEIGTTRADVLQRKSEAELATTLAERAQTLERNVVDLVAALKEQPSFDAIKQQFADRILGDYRQQLITSYSHMQLAESLAEGREALANSGVLSGKQMQERTNAARSARAEFESTCEQAELDVWQHHSEAEAAARDARRRAEIAQQKLAALLLREAVTDNEADSPLADSLGASDIDLTQLSRVAVRAPFAGTIESRNFSASERITATDSMFVLADTSTLWIAAEIRENDWPAVAVETGQSLSVGIPALGDAKFDAQVEYIGREVSTDTNAIPIVAVIDNADRRLRPGLFVRVSVPVGVKPDVLTLPTEAVLRHDGQAFVFVSEGDNQFRRADVKTGDDNGQRVEIVSGVQDNDRIVTDGAFVLKSELLLEGEGE